jgi:16S rRNA (uracil1498-N3)-methyltransferase
LRIPRFHITQSLCSGVSITLEEEVSRHLYQVLRLRSGDAIILFDPYGNEHSATLTLAAKHSSEALIGEKIRQEPKPALTLHLIIGLSRGDRMDFALQKATELGVTHITPTFMQRSVVKLDMSKRLSRMAHWRKVITNACEQSGRCRLPQLDEPCNLATAISHQNAQLALLLDHRGTHSLSSLSPPESSVSILIGPEGGLSAEERTHILHKGFQGIRLGPRILRTETAPLAAIAAIQTLWGDFKDPSPSHPARVNPTP